MFDTRLARSLLALLLLGALTSARDACPQSPPADAGSDADLFHTVERATRDNPDVRAAWYAFESSRAERGVARANYMPRLDFAADAGRERSETPLRADNRYSPGSQRLSLSQMIFDGFATRREVSRLDHAMRVRYHEFEQSAEAVALDAVTAYYDVLRRETLVTLAEDNYAEHRRIFGEIEQRVVAGVSRRVDLEQAGARLALAETNALIETANLHDVTARFQRVIGMLPAEDMPPPELPIAKIPEQSADALRVAYAHNPRIKAARESVAAAVADRQSRNAPMLPRVDVRLTRQLNDDTDGIEGSYRKNTAELVVSYNIFNGGADRARVKQFESRVSTARELRESACREVRQTVAIAHNDIKSLTAQVDYLNRNQLAIGKARLTYRQQFSIGQRTLLDLLDSENEYFEIRRRYVNARYDLGIAQARTLGAMGMLREALGVDDRAEEAGIDVISSDSASGCPLDAPPPMRLRRREPSPSSSLPDAPPPTVDALSATPQLP